MKKWISILLICLLANPAFGQGTFPLNNLPLGKGTGKTGFTALAPGSNGQCLVITGGVPVYGDCLADATISNAKLIAGPANTMKGSLNGVATSDIAITACTLTYQFTKWVAGTGWQCGINPVLPSRVVALTLDLAAFTSVMTQGYTTPGDGGAANFVKTTGVFVDRVIATGSLTGNGTSGCTNGTFLGVQSSSAGAGLQAYWTVVVAGGIVTSITNVVPGNSWSAGEVAVFTMAGCTSNPTYTIATVTAPTGSFTDTGSTKWQILMPAEGIDSRAFGVKFDWNRSGGDGAATDNFTTLQNVANFAGASADVIDTGVSNGGLVLIARGTAMICGGGGGGTAFVVPQGVTFRGQGPVSSIIKICDIWGTATNYIELCSTATHLACFGTQLDSLQVFATASHDAGAGVSGLSAIYSNNIQQLGAGLHNVLIYPGACRRGVTLESGFGGAAQVHALDDVEIKGGQTAANCGGNTGVGIYINYGTTQVTMDRVTISGLPAALGPRPIGMLINGGFVEINAIYAENVVAPLQVNIQTSLANGMVRLHNFDAGTSCVWGVSLISTNQPGNFLIGGPMAVNSCSSGLVLDAQPAGTNMTTPQVSDKIFNP